MDDRERGIAEEGTTTTAKVSRAEENTKKGNINKHYSDLVMYEYCTVPTVQ